MRKFISDMKFELVDKLGVNFVKRKLNAFNRNVAVLMYHGVIKDSLVIAKNDWCQAKESEFEQQMEFLSKHYDVVPFMDMDKEPFSDKPRAVITFDDGYANNYTIALKYLKKYNLPATIFLTSRLLSKPDKMFSYWYDVVNIAMTLEDFSEKSISAYVDDMKELYTRDECCEIANKMLEKLNIPEYVLSLIYNAYAVLSEQQIKEMSKYRITVGSHTVDHALLTHVNWNETEEQISKSHDELKGLENYIPVFCYPNGWKTRMIVDRVSEVYEMAVLANGGLYNKEKHSRCEIPRIGIGKNTDIVRFKGLLASYK